MSRMVVDLPAPLGPRKPRTCPRGTVRLMPSTALSVPKLLVSPCASISAVIVFPPTFFPAICSQKVSLSQMNMHSCKASEWMIQVAAAQASARAATAKVPQPAIRQPLAAVCKRPAGSVNPGVPGQRAFAWQGLIKRGRRRQLAHAARHRDRRRLAQGLVDHAVALGELHRVARCFSVRSPSMSKGAGCRGSPRARPWRRPGCRGSRGRPRP